MPAVSSGSIAEGAPLNQAHEHATMADDLHSLGDLEGAVAEHKKAAEDYLACIEYTTDHNLQTTLRRMHMDQQKAGEDLQRRIVQKERERDLNRLPHKSRPNAAHRFGRDTSGYLSPPSNDDRSPSRTPIQSQIAFKRMQDSGMSDRTSGAESFMVLGGAFSEYGERFNKWWGNVEGLLDKLSQPVALTTAPLAPWEISESSSSTDTDPGEVTLSKTRSSRSAIKGKAKTKEDPVVDLAFDADDSSDSDFFIIPPVKTTSRQSTVVGPSPNEARLKEENDKLRNELEQMKEKLAKAETAIKVRAGQEAQLRDSIMFAKREAQRALVSSTTFRGPTIPNLSHNPTAFSDASPFMPSHPPGTTSPPTPVLQKKIKDLEEEIKSVKTENEKQKAQITKFREKWASLKESARKKRSLKEATSAVSQGFKEPIEEENEEEISNSVPGHLPDPNRDGSSNNAGSGTFLKRANEVVC